MKEKSWLYFSVKRIFDIFSSIFMIILVSPLLLIILIINLFVTKGAPIYLDTRVGKDGKVLRIPKFRSMHKDANVHPEKYLNGEQMEEWKKERKVTDDPRVTGFGKFLRKSSCDELLQLFCILIGTMSVVGPRPVIQEEIDKNYSEEERKILLSARPGLISNWGVNGRNLVSYTSGERQKLELVYFNKRSIWYDFFLILKAIIAVLNWKGAQ